MEESSKNDEATAREVLLTFYRENALQSRSYEQQRQSVTSAVVVAAAILIGFSMAEPDSSHAVGGLFLIVLGGHGFLACLRHYERGRLHVERVHAVRDEISKVYPVMDLYAEANEKHARRFPTLSEKTARTNLIWLGLHVAVAGLGAVLLVL